jgi:hypothetical protein
MIPERVEAIQTKINSYDFFIKTVAGSGSHMLMSALNSHPDINCLDETGPRNLPEKPDDGRKHGAIIHGIAIIEVPLLVLVRDPVAIARRFTNLNKTGKHFFYEPGVEINYTEAEVPYAEQRYKHILEMQREVMSHPAPKLVMQYEDLTQDKDTRVLPNSREICEFLGVEVRDLVPETYKPVVNTNVK